MLAAVGATLVAGCSSPERSEELQAAAYRGTDSLDRTVVLEVQPVRLVSLAPNITEILYALGAGTRVVGVTTYCNYPPEVTGTRRVGDFSNPSLERIVTLEPDLVFLTSHEQGPLLSKLEGLGLRAFVVYPQTIAELQGMIGEIGALIGCEDEAETLAAEIGGLWKGAAEERRPRVFLEITEDPLMTVGDDSFVGEMIRLAGGENIAHDLPRRYAVISPERVIAADPEVIIVAHPGASRETVGQRLGWGRIEAVRSGRVYDDIDPDLIMRAGPRVVQGVAALRACISEAR